jgi:hypothetical protein
VTSSKTKKTNKAGMSDYNVVLDDVPSIVISWTSKYRSPELDTPTSTALSREPEALCSTLERDLCK